MLKKIQKRKRLLLLPAIMLWQALAAQTDVEAVIADCAAMSSYDGRVGCLEEALRRASDAEPAPAITNIEDAPESDAANVDVPQAAPRDKTPQALAAKAATPAAEPAVDVAPAAAAATLSTLPPAERAKQVPAQNTVAETQVDAAPMASPTEESAAAAAEVERFGLSDVEREIDKPTSITVMIVAIEADPFGKKIFSTENGQVWKQTDRNAPRYRNLPFEAEIRKGAMGSYFMKPVSSSRSIRVRRSR